MNRSLRGVSLVWKWCLGCGLALVLGWGLAMSIPAAQAESVASVVERVVRTNPTVGAAYFESKASGMAVETSAALRKPRLSLSAQTGLNKTRVNQNGTYGADLSVSQRLYDGGEVSSQIRKSRAELGAATGRYDDAVLAT